MRIKTELAEMPPAFTVTREGTEAIIIFYTDVQEVQREDGTSYEAISWVIRRPWADTLRERVTNATAQWLGFAKDEAYAEAADEVRAERNKLLADTDADMCFDRMGLTVPTGSTFTAWLSFLKGLGSVLTNGMAAYRQSLRDITAQPGFPYEVTWPEKPE